MGSQRGLFYDIGSYEEIESAGIKGILIPPKLSCVYLIILITYKLIKIKEHIYYIYFMKVLLGTVSLLVTLFLALILFSPSTAYIHNS